LDNRRFGLQVDISGSIGYLLAVKDNEELNLIRKACEITGKLYSKHLKDQIINIVDSERVGKQIQYFFELIFSFSESQTFEII
jgi:Xaa-Pro aminopeptidase